MVVVYPPRTVTVLLMVTTWVMRPLAGGEI